MNYKDIARLAKCGIGTVSRYFNKKNISAKMKARIEKVLENKIYHPNYGARLIQGTDRVVFLIIPNWEDSTSNFTIKAIQNEIDQIDYKLFVIQGSFDANKYIEILKNVLHRKPAKLILFLPYLNPELVEFIQSIKIPIVVYGKKINRVPSIYIDDYALMNSFTNNLIAKKAFKKIAYIGKTIKDETTGKFRYEGFMNACSENNLSPITCLWENKNSTEVDDFLKKCQAEKFELIICGTHNTFQQIVAKIDFDNQIALTDIGYQDFDDFNPKYLSKIFIDYYEIGIRIFYFLFHERADLLGLFQVKII